MNLLLPKIICIVSLISLFDSKPAYSLDDYKDCEDPRPRRSVSVSRASIGTQTCSILSPEMFGFELNLRTIFDRFMFKKVASIDGLKRSESSFGFGNNSIDGDLMHSEISIITIDSLIQEDPFYSLSSLDVTSDIECSFEHKSDRERVMDLVQEHGVEISTQTSIKLADFINPETRVQRMRRICLESYIRVMNNFFWSTLHVLSIGEIICPIVVLYFLYFSSADTSCEKYENNNYIGLFITISFFCSTIKQSFGKLIAFRDKVVKFCGMRVKPSQETSDKRMDSCFESSLDSK